MLLSVVPFSAIANSIPTIGNENDLIDAAATGGEYTLTNSIDLSSPLTVNKDLTLNMEEYSIYADENSSVFTDSDALFEVSGATLIFNGKGYINHCSAGSAFLLTGAVGKATKVVVEKCSVYVNQNNINTNLVPKAFFVTECPSGAT